ncbi:oxygen-dependent protoporphyrinogen oxidase [Actinomortierella ambigua]|nr:oxygen-dependent protoporphyrinogen oxidase [Actinomortierella ambigua]
MPPSSHIAILGGGISGLSTAWYLTRASPSVRVTLLEAANRTGGWISSSRQDDSTHGGSFLLEHGPRSLRPQGISGLNTLELVRELGLDGEVAPVPKTSPAAKNRFIYARNKLHMVPTSLAGLLTHPLVAPKIPRASLDLVLPQITELEDESIESFVTRRFGRGISDDLVSAMVHGIYAGDAKKLSVRSTFGMLYHTEREYRSVIMGMLRGGGSVVETAWDQALKERILAKMPDLNDFVAKTSIYSFQNGMQALSDTLERKLIETGRVKILKGANVDHLDFNLAERSVSISIPHQPLLHADMVIAAIAPRKLSRLLPRPHKLLNYNGSVNVAVVNLVYPGCQQTFKTPGFGFLMPKSEDPAAKHKGLLGVVFDSCALPSQDKGEARGKNLKLTAMLGGHLFEETLARHGLLPTITTSTPNKGRSEKMTTSPPLDDATMKALASNPQIQHFFKEAAKEAVRDKLQLNVEPSLVEAHLQWECIPQYRPGHLTVMEMLDDILRRDYDGLLAVTGAGYLGVSVNDCIKNGRELAENLVAKLEEDATGESALVGRREPVTGLERSNFM